ncbi:Gfo/Idh/MocA family protein [Bacillaceae bacterium C204]|uniref:Gfo/Idh/MocA family protein n=1 Tax=Neobacillus sp. 204 TaxID=3383351 RepID=UPI0039797D08
MRTVKIGIIGTGFSANSHIEALSRIPFVEVIGIAGSSLEKAQKMAEKYGIDRIYSTVDELIDDPGIEAIHNCTPNYLHYTINKKILLQNKHLMSEKPLAMNSRESKELAELAQSANVVSGICFNYRHYPLVIQTKELTEGSELGQVHHVFGGYFQDWLLYQTDYNWRLDPERNGKSRAIADIGSHWCDTIQFILGKKIVEVFADLKTVHPVRLKPVTEAFTFENSDSEEMLQVKIETEDYGSVLVHFEDGIKGVFTVSQVSGGRKNKLFFDIAFEKGSVSWDQEKPNKLWIGKRDEPNQELLRDPSLLHHNAAKAAHYPGGHEEGWPDGLKNLFIDFYTAVMEGKETIDQSHFATLKDGHRVMEIVEAILESHEKRSWVSLKEID